MMVNAPFFHFFTFFLALRASDRAIATACFCGCPVFFSSRMFLLIVFWEYPFFNGVVSPCKIKIHCISKVAIL